MKMIMQWNGRLYIQGNVNKLRIAENGMKIESLTAL